MKIKAILLFVSLMLFMGVVNASSINGEIDGHPIIKITSGGKEIETGMVPGFIYENRPMVPISALTDIGVYVNFNDADNTVDISVPEVKPGISVNALMRLFGSNGTMKHLLDYLEYKVNSDDSNQLNLYTKGDYEFEDYERLLLIASAVDVQKIRVEGPGRTIEFFKPADIKSYFLGEITSSEFASRIEVVEKASPIPTAVKPAPAAATPAPAYTNTTTIETTIDGDFEGWTGETIFKLSNGQIWQQTSYAYTYSYAYSPKVLIYKDGSRYKMKVDGVEKTIDVKQLK